MKIKKIIIWGHKFGTHTHSYIHNSYYKAFRSLCYDTYWFDNSDKDCLINFDFTNSLFFTEGQVDQEIPLIKNCIYILHHCKSEKYIEAGGRILNLCNYLKYCEDGISFNYRDVSNRVEKISPFFFYDKKAKAIYQPWATDLLPSEISRETICSLDDNKKQVNYIGSIWSENINEIQPFIDACRDNGKDFKNYGYGISDLYHKELIKHSYIAPDIRGAWHKECGYIPCRIFKNISYGQVTGTNSKHVADMFSFVAYSDNTYELFNKCVDKFYSLSLRDMINVMSYIRDYHTYINRIRNILYILDNY